MSNIADTSGFDLQSFVEALAANPGIDPQDVLDSIQGGNVRDISDASSAASSQGSTSAPINVVAHDHHDVPTGGSILKPSELTLPFTTSPAQTLEGQIVWDSDDDKLTVGTGSGRKTLVNSPVTESDISLSDVTTDDVSSTKHGLAPKSPADATKFLNGAATPAFAQVKDSDLVTSDVTTNNVSTSKHGFAPKAPNDATKYLDGTGAYSRVGNFRGAVTSNPASPSTNDWCIRTDLGRAIYYDGTRWLTFNEYSIIGQGAYTGTLACFGDEPIRTDYAPWVTRIAIKCNVSTTNDGSNYYTWSIRGVNLAFNAATTLLTGNTSADAVNTWLSKEADATTHNPSNKDWIDECVQATGSPGQITIYFNAYYRLIIT